MLPTQLPTIAGVISIDQEISLLFMPAIVGIRVGSRDPRLPAKSLLNKVGGGVNRKKLLES